MIFWAFMLGFSILMGCVTLSQDQSLLQVQNLPSLNDARTDDPARLQSLVEGYVEANPSTEAKRWALYEEAILWQEKDPGRSCKAFLSLATDKSFPLFDLAELRMLSVCPVTEESALSWARYRSLSKDRPWLRHLALEVAEKNALALNRYQDLVEIYKTKAGLSPRQKDKEAYLQKAIALSQKLDDAQQTQELLNRLFQVASRLTPEPRLAEYLNVARDFRNAREFTKARGFYNKILKAKKSADEDRLKALAGIRVTYKLEKNTDHYVASSLAIRKMAHKHWRKKTKDLELSRRYHDASVQYARTLWTEGQIQQTLQELNALEGHLKARYPLEEIHWLRGRIDEEAQKYSQAQGWFEKGLARLTPKSSWKERLQWSLAWVLHKQGRDDESSRVLMDLKEQTVSPFERAKYSFWLARTLKGAGQEAQSLAELKDLMESDPLGFYGLLAYRDTHLSIPSAPKPGEEKLKNRYRVFDNHYDLRYMEWLLATDENQIAGLFLSAYVDKFFSRKEQDTAVWSEVLRYFLKSAQYTTLFRTINSLDPALRSRLVDENMEFLFPRPHFDVVAQASQRFGVSADLIYSIMRQESAFDPLARSPADAFGLLQLIPEAAKIAAENTEIVYEKPEDLFRPEVNIPLGASFLRRLLDSYKGQFVLSVASYNASEKAIKGWLQSRLKEDPIEFIEDIPYEETRGYVKLVLRNFIFYTRLGAPASGLPFPEWTLEGLKAFR